MKLSWPKKVEQLADTMVRECMEVGSGKLYILVPNSARYGLCHNGYYYMAMLASNGILVIVGSNLYLG